MGARPQIMGILNVTPDSFSDGGRWADAAAAIAHAVTMRDEGADLVDVGGESTRPGAGRVPGDEERARVLPVVRELKQRGIPVSVDTMNAATALAAVDAGAGTINDVSGGLADPDMSRVVAETGVRYIAMHWRAHSSTMQQFASYDDVVAEVRNELAARVEQLLSAGVSPEKIVIDPGLGFAKNAEHNWALLAGLPHLGELGYPVLVGASRKKFLAGLVPEGAPTESRDLPSAVVSALAAGSGAWGVRVHDVAMTRTALDVWSAWAPGGAE